MEDVGAAVEVTRRFKVAPGNDAPKLLHCPTRQILHCATHHSSNAEDAEVRVELGAIEPEREDGKKERPCSVDGGERPPQKPCTAFDIAVEGDIVL